MPASTELKSLGNNLISSSDLLATELGKYANDTSRELTTLQITLAVLNIGVQFLMLYIILRILKPVKLLTKATAAVQEGSLDISVERSGNDELQNLVESFNSMVRSLRLSSHMLAMEKKKYHDLYDGAPDLYRMTDRKGIVLDCNDCYVRSLGYSDKSELIGKSIYETTADASLDAMRESFETWRRNGIVENKEVWLKRKDGSVFPTLISATAMTLFHGNTEIVASNTCIIDVTKMYKAKRELEEANRQLREADKMKTEFISIASHELRTPIQPILNYANLANKGLVSHQEALVAITQQARRLQRLANDILDVSRIEGGGLPLDIQQFSINEVVKSCLDEKNLSTSEGVQIKLALATDGDALTVHADWQRLVQALTNILGNALKFTKIGSVEVSTQAVYDGRYVEICISDTGSGIPHEILPVLFTKFATKSVDKGTEHGTGIGLFISRAIVKSHGGSIVGYNNPKLGATFKIWLPGVRNPLTNQEDLKEKTKRVSATAG
jgi:PAS domain S-box-containing protein